MAKRSEFVEYLMELLQDCGLPASTLKCRAMFGGYGVYFNDTMFGLVADDTFYLKLGSNNAADFEERELPPFSYSRNGKTYNMSYAEAPEDLYDDAEVMHVWVNKAIDAAMAAANEKHNKKKKQKN